MSVKVLIYGTICICMASVAHVESTTGHGGDSDGSLDHKRHLRSLSDVLGSQSGPQNEEKDRGLQHQSWWAESNESPIFKSVDPSSAWRSLRHNFPPRKLSRNPPTKKGSPPTKRTHDSSIHGDPPTRDAFYGPKTEKSLKTVNQDAAPPNIHRRGRDKKDEMSLAEQACAGGRFINCKKGTVTSLGYPDQYPSNATCNWMLRAPDNMVVQVDFIDFALGDGDCVTLSYSNSAVAEIYDPAVMSCGRQPPTRRKFTSIGNELYITLTTGDTAGGRGLLFDFNTREPVECEDTIELIGASGKLTSVGYPQHYLPRANCTWRVVGPHDTTLNVKFEDMAIEQARSCDYDAVTLYDGATTFDGRLGVYCGHTTPGDIITSSNVFTVVLTADESAEDEGFVLTWEVADNV